MKKYKTWKDLQTVAIIGWLIAAIASFSRTIDLAVENFGFLAVVAAVTTILCICIIVKVANSEKEKENDN